MFRRIVPMIGFFAGFGVVLAAAPAWAQVNIDQGKSPAEMFSGDCATCHKSAKGLANGRNAGALAGFLREHYTSGPQQAAALAAYVLGAGSGPAPTANLKPGTAAGESKSSEAKPSEKPGDRTRPGRPESSSTAKLQQPDQDTKIEAEPANEPAPAANGRKPPAGKHEPKSVTASRGQRPERETPPPTPEAAPITAPITAPVATPETTPAPVATAPATSEPSNPAAPAEAQPAMPVTAAAPGAVPEASSAPAAAAPANSEASPSANAAEPGEAPAENTPVPRDDIPD